MDTLTATLQAFIAFVIGGGISRLLDAWPAWANWHPTWPFAFLMEKGTPLPFLKAALVFVIVAAVILVLATLYQLLPSLFPKLPVDAQSIIVLFASLLGSYIRNQSSSSAALKEQVGQLTAEARYIPNVGFVPVVPNESRHEINTHSGN